MERTVVGLVEGSLLGTIAGVDDGGTIGSAVGKAECEKLGERDSALDIAVGVNDCFSVGLKVGVCEGI